MYTKMSTLSTSTAVFNTFLIGILLPLIILVNGINPVVATQLTNCSQVNCPPLSEIICPNDSFIRETNEETNVIASPDDHYEIVEEVFIQCCVSQKCACRTCHIPSCHNESLVIRELQPETQIPGKCCGDYDCIFEPNCTEVIDTENYWLTNCRRCKCTEGKKDCLTVCDESMMMQMIPHTTVNNTNVDEGNIASCFSKKLNQFFMSGEKWKEDDDCTACECFGEHAKCEEICIIPPTVNAGGSGNENRPEPTCISSQLNKIFTNGEKWEEDNCTHCECVSGEKICHNACENLLIETSGPINCISTDLKRSFSNDEIWQEDNGCSHCKCENGEKRCQTSFCKLIHCKKEIKIPGECCSRCLDEEQNITTSIILPSAATEETLNSGSEINTTATPIILIPKYFPSSTIAQIDDSHHDEGSTSPAPAINTVTTTYQISETVTQNPPPKATCPPHPDQNAVPVQYHDDDLITKLYYVIGFLFVILCIISALYGFERRKRSMNSRSYDPVSHTDDNFNRILTIKPITSYTYSYENEKEKINQNGKELNEK